MNEFKLLKRRFLVLIVMLAILIAISGANTLFNRQTENSSGNTSEQQETDELPEEDTDKMQEDESYTMEDDILQESLTRFL